MCHRAVAWTSNVTYIRGGYALAFLHVDCVIHTLGYLFGDDSIPAEFITYLEATCIGTVKG